MSPRRGAGSLGCLGGCLLVVLPILFIAGGLYLFWYNPEWLDELAFWRGEIIPADQLDPIHLTPAARPEFKPPPEPDALNLDLGGLPAVETAASWISAAQGGEVRLSDGTGVILPPGALSSDREVRVRRLGGDEPTLSMVTATEVDAGEGNLHQDVTVILPVPAGEPGLERLGMKYRVLHAHGGKATELPCQPGPGPGQVTVKTRRCSILTVLGLAIAVETWLFQSRLYEEVLANHVELSRSVPPLPVPYFYQGQANWCFAAASSMMVHAHGGQASVSEIASHFRLEFLQGMGNPSGYWAGGLGRVLSAYQPELTRVPWFEPSAAALYICRNLTAGQPVYVDLYKIQHAVVAVGYDHRGLYIHDPSGHAFQAAGMTDYLDRIREGRVAAVLLPWEKYIQLSTRWRLPIPIYTYVMRAPMSGQPPVSVQLLHDNVAFIHPTPIPYLTKRPWISNYAWDGQCYKGHTTVIRNYSATLENRADFLTNASQQTTPSHPCNGDRYSITALVSSPVPAPGEITVQAFLDDQPLGPPQTWDPPSGGMEAQRSKSPMDLTPVTGEPLPFRVDPGPAKLRADVCVDGVRIDYEEITLNFGPSRVSNVRLTPEPDGIYLEWDPAPEYGVTYVIRIVENELAFGVEVARTEDTRWQVPKEFLEKQRPAWLYVQTLHRNTDLYSVPSDHLDLRDPWEGRWKGKIKLIEGALFETGDRLLNLYFQALVGKEVEEETKLQQKIQQASPDEASRLQSELAKHREDTGKYKDILKSVQDMLSSLMLAADLVARIGIPVTFELKKKDAGQYDLLLRDIFYIKTPGAEAVTVNRAGPNTLGFDALEDAAFQDDEALARFGPPPRLRLHRWNTARGDTVISHRLDPKPSLLVWKWEFKRD